MAIVVLPFSGIWDRCSHCYYFLKQAITSSKELSLMAGRSSGQWGFYAEHALTEFLKVPLIEDVF